MSDGCFWSCAVLFFWLVMFVGMIILMVED